MTIRISCPHCLATQKAEWQHAGEQIHCSACGATVAVAMELPFEFLGVPSQSEAQPTSQFRWSGRLRRHLAEPTTLLNSYIVGCVSAVAGVLLTWGCR